MDSSRARDLNPDAVRLMKASDTSRVSRDLVAALGFAPCEFRVGYEPSSPLLASAAQ